jgi:hypothetical protein
MADDALIASLRSAGATAGGGVFTLDPVKAREKLREFQLADPHRYILLLVQALVVRGATRVDVEVDTDDLRISSDARPFTFEEITELYALLFSDEGPRPGLRELALALNAVMATDPRWVRLECADETGADGVRLEQRNDQPDKVERATGLEPGVRVHVRERFRLGLVRRFFAVGSDIVREQVLLRQHCGFAGIEITLGKKPIPKHKAATDVQSWHAVSLDGRTIGEVGLSQVGDKGRLELVRHNVWLGTHSYDDPQLAGLRGTIDVSHLRTDASLADVVRDDLYQVVIAAVHDARDMALAAAARSHRGGDGVFVGPVREVLCARIGALLAQPDADRRAEPLRDFLGVALWHTIGGGHVSSRELLEADALRYSTVDATPPPAEVAHIVYAKGRAAELFRQAFGDSVQDETAVVGRAKLRDANRRAFDERLHAVVLPEDGRYDRVFPFESAHVRGIIGWAQNVGPSWIRFIVDNRLLVELPIASELGSIRSVGSLRIVVSAAFTPTDLVDDVARDETFGKALHACIAAHSELLREHCHALLTAPRIAASVSEGLLAHALEVIDGTHARKWLAALGLAATTADALCDELGRPWQDDLTLDANGKLAHPLAALPLFEDASGAPIDLHRILDALQRDRFIRIVTVGRPQIRAAPHLVVRVGELRLSLLQALCGKGNVRRIGREYEGWLARERFLDTLAPRELQLDSEVVLGPIEIVHEGERGLVGIARAEGGGATRDATPIVPFVQSRPIATQQLGPTVRGLVAAFALPERALDHTCSGLDTAGMAQATGMLATALGALLDTVIDHDVGHPKLVERVVLDAVALACPAPNYMLAWMRLGVLEPEQQIDRYVQLLEVGDEREPSTLHNALSSMLLRNELPDAAKIREALGKGNAKRSSWSATRLAAVHRLPKLLALPLFTNGAGAKQSLRDVIAHIGTHGTFGYLPPMPEVPPALADVVQLDAAAVEALRAVFGASKLRDRTPEIAVARQRLAFERRTPLTDLTLPEGSTLVAIVVEIAGIRGTIGVPKRDPTAGPGKVTVTHGRRPIIDVDPTPPTAWVGIIDGDGFGEESDFEGLTERERERIAEIFASHRGIVMSALCGDGLSGGDGDLRRRWVQHLAQAVLPLSGFQQSSLEHADIADLADAPLFIDAEGAVLSIAALGDEHERHGNVAIVRRAGLRTNRRLVLVRDEIEHALLRHLFGELADAEPLALRRLEFEARCEEAEPLPTTPPDAFAVDEIDARGLTGALWLAASTAPTIALGLDGRILSQWPGSRMFPCSGAITGEGVTIADDYTGGALSRSREDFLKSRAALLYVRLAATIKDACPPVDDPRSFVLRELLLRLHEVARSGRKWPSHEMRRLHRDLQDAPLLPLASGRAVSLRTALQTRPAELEELLDGGEARERPVEDVAVPHEVPASPVAPPPIEPPRIEPPRIEPPRIEPPRIEPPRIGENPTARPPPELPPPAIPREQLLRDAIRAELRLLHRRDMSLVTEPHLDRIGVAILDGRRIATRGGPRIVVDAGHPIVMRAMAVDADPLLVSVIASAALTALNFAFDDVSDTDEARLLRLHAEHLLTARAEPPAAPEPT